MRAQTDNLSFFSIAILVALVFVVLLLFFAFLRPIIELLLFIIAVYVLYKLALRLSKKSK